MTESDTSENESNMSDEEALMKFISEFDDDFAKIEAECDKVNIFDILKLGHHEIRHSNFLAWLLDPNENHKLGDYFLKKFLKDIINSYEVESVNLFDIERFDLNSCEIKREWKNIDILILNDEDKFVCVIENKVYSKESKGQTEKYRKIIDNEYKDYKKIFVLLSKDGDEAQDNDNYVSYKHENIYTILKIVQKNKKDSLNEMVNIFINQYIVILDRIMVENNNIQQICQSIYKKHKKALDLIFENKPDRELEINKIISDVLKELKNEGKNLVLDDCTKIYLRFRPNEFSSLDGIKNCDIWTKSRFNLLFEIRIQEILSLCLVLADKGKIPIFTEKFNKLLKTNPKSKKWTTYKLETIFNKNYKEKDDDELKTEIKDKLSKFLESKEYKEIINNVQKSLD